MKGMEQGVVCQFDNDDYFFQAVLIGQNIYARALEKSEEVKKAQKENSAPDKKD